MACFKYYRLILGYYRIFHQIRLLPYLVRTKVLSTNSMTVLVLYDTPH